MFAGDKGPMRPQRTDSKGGLPPSSVDPIVAEFEILTPLDPDDLRGKAQAYLGALGVTKTSTLPPNAPHIIIGSPRLVVRGASELSVWTVLNSSIKGWAAIPSGVPGDNGTFTDSSTGEGLYTNGGNNVYVYARSSGQTFLDDITAAVLNTGVVYNAHSPGYAASVYHEIFHTFEGTLMASSFFFKEGIVEWFSDQFRKAYYGVQEPYYPPYEHAAQNVEKMVRFATTRALALAYFMDDKDSIDQVVGVMYGPIAKSLPLDDRVAQDCIDDSTMKWGELKRMLNVNTAMLTRKDASVAWYSKYVASKGVPEGGPALPVAKPTPTRLVMKPRAPVVSAVSPVSPDTGKDPSTFPGFTL
jgi:hypothetical protein